MESSEGVKRGEPGAEYAETCRTVDLPIVWNSRGIILSVSVSLSFFFLLTIASSLSMLNPSHHSRPQLSSTSSRKTSLIIFCFCSCPLFYVFSLRHNLHNVKSAILK